MFTQGRIRVVSLWAADVICVVAVWGTAVSCYWLLGRALAAIGIQTGIGGYSPSDYLVFWPVPLVFTLVNSIFDLYHGNWMYPAAPLPPVEEMRRLIGSSFLTHIGVLAFLAFAHQTTEGVSRVVMAVSGVLVAFASQSFRNWARWMLYGLNIGQIPVLLAGGGEVARRVVAMLQGNAYSGMRIVGYFEGTERKECSRCRGLQSDAALSRLGVRYLGSLRDIVKEAKKRDIKILLACQDERLFRQQIKELSGWFTFIEFLPTAQVFPVFGSKPVSFGGIGGLEMVNQGRMKVKRFQKHLLDMFLALCAFIVLLPLFAIIPGLIKLTSRGPVFFRQKRLGIHGRTIYVWKFRSMYEDAESRLAKLLAENPNAAEEWNNNFKLAADPRVTPFGRVLRKTSLDELPQLLNVLSGEMALIGPRPIVENEIPYYGNSYDVFSSVKPGITGLWQVSGRSDTSYSERVSLDTYYVLNWSPWMDVWILVRTVYAVLFMRGAR